nr:hypothetical protein [Tanacetum cinerariifolium]
MTRNKCYLTDYEEYDGRIDSFRDDETIYKEWEDIIERAATTASSLEVEQDDEVGEGLGLHTDSHHTPNDTQPSLSKPQKRIKPKRKHRQETKVHSPSSEIPVEESIPTPSNDPIPSEEAKTAQAKEIANLKKRVNKLEIRRKSRPAGLRRLKKVGSSKQVESSKEKDSLGAQEDASKHGRSTKDIDQDVEIVLVDKAQGRMHDAYMFGVDDLEGNEEIIYVREKIVEKEVSTADPVTTTGEVVTAASVEDSAAPTTATTTDVDDELTLAKTLIAIKAAKLKVISTAATIVTTAITTPRAKGQELEKESTKKQKLAKQEQAKVADNDTTKLKRCLEIFPEDVDDDVAIKATTLSSKSPTIVDYKIYREGKKSYFKIIREDGNS